MAVEGSYATSTQRVRQPILGGQGFLGEGVVGPKWPVSSARAVVMVFFGFVNQCCRGLLGAKQGVVGCA